MGEKSPDICRPGFNASCALCCGSHNYRATRDELTALFKKRSGILKKFSGPYLVRRMTASRSNLTGSYYFTKETSQEDGFAPIHGRGIQCPYVGYVDDDEKLAGCLLYGPDVGPDLRRDCYHNYSSKNFNCPSKGILSDDEIIFAARLMGDWYYYSILIHRVDFLRGLVLEYSEPENVSEQALEEIKAELADCIHRDESLHCINSYF